MGEAFQLCLATRMRNRYATEWNRMAIVTINKKQFENEIGKLSEDMQHKIAMFGTTLENFDDKEIELEIFPNRPDLLSMQNYIQAFKAFLGKSHKQKEYKLNKPTNTKNNFRKKNRSYDPCSGGLPINF